MLYTIPNYYPKFTCTADRCEDTCCAGWQIAIDQESMDRYQNETGPYQQKLKSSILWPRQCFRQDGERRCAFLTDDNLCDMYLNLGPESLCESCRRYPRHIEEFENVREVSLSLSCPEVAKILVDQKDPVTFIDVEEGEEEEEDFSEYDPLLYSKLTEARTLLIEMMQNRNLPVENRIVLCLGLAYDVQNRVKKRKLFACDEVFLTYRKQTYFSAAGREVDAFYRSPKRRMRFSRRQLKNLTRLEPLKEDWYQRLLEMKEVLYPNGESYYVALEDEFDLWLMGQQEIDWPILCEQLMVYDLYTYFCGAVYDGEVFENVQFAVAGCFMIRELMLLSWLRNEKTLSKEEVVDLITRYSREVEHSEKNMKKMFGMLKKQEKDFLYKGGNHD